MNFGGKMDEMKIYVEKLNGVDNWRNWKMEVEDMLVIKDVFEMVMEEVSEPVNPGTLDQTAKDKYLKELKAFKLKFSRARSILHCSLGADPRSKVLACTTPFQIWTKLHSIYEQKSTCRLRRLLAQIMRAKMESGVDMASHLARMRSNWADLQQAAQQEEEVSIPECILIECVFESLPKEQYREFNSLWDTL